jgi:hypothetical protein
MPTSACVVAVEDALLVGRLALSPPGDEAQYPELVSAQAILESLRLRGEGLI